MDKLNFYTADSAYVQYLKKAEHDKRGFSRVPNMAYSEKYKQKFLCGIVLRVNDVDYYVPVTSYKQQKPDNFLIVVDSEHIVSSLRFNYMFPIPRNTGGWFCVEIHNTIEPSPCVLLVQVFDHASGY